MQTGVAEQLTDRFARRLPADQCNECRVGQQHVPGAVQCQHRIGHGGEQRVQLQVATLTRKDVDHGDRFHTTDPKQRVLELFEHLMAERRRIDVHVGRYHLHRVQIQIASTQNRQHFLGDTDAVDEADMDAHEALTVRE